LESRVRKEPELLPNAKISIKDIAQVIDRLLGSHEVSVLKGLTTQAKLLVCALVSALDKPTKSTKSKSYIPSLTYDKLHEVYKSTCKQAGIPSVDSSSFKDLVDVLLSNGRKNCVYSQILICFRNYWIRKG
jgi:Cdc6-like AAA superfamily ATPase